MRRPIDGAPTVGIDPGHILGQQDTDGDTQHGYDRDQRGARETADEIIPAAQRRGEDDLVRAIAEVASRRRIDEGRSYQQRQQSDERIEILDDERRVTVSIQYRVSQREL